MVDSDESTSRARRVQRASVRRAALGSAIAMFAVACGLVSRDEVARVTSPDARIEAILIETNGGATTPFGYEIWLREKDHESRERVATLYGAVRNESAAGVNLRWMDDTQLVVEYQEARTEALDKPSVTIGGRDVHVALKPHVSDPTAPAGGMLSNLERAKQ
jgi:hypothetical protein